MKIKNFKLFVVNEGDKGLGGSDEEQSAEVNKEIIDLKRLGDSITILGGDKNEEKFREAFKDHIVIPAFPNTGDVTYDGNNVGYVDNFSGLVFTDVKWIATHLDKINDIIKETGFWYGEAN